MSSLIPWARPDPDLLGLEADARRALTASAYEWIAAGAGEGTTAAENVAAWSRLRLRPHVLRDVAAVDTSCSLLGTRLPTPIAIAPTSHHELCHPEGEIATARGAAGAGALMLVSTGSDRTLEEIAAAAPDAHRWLQVYVRLDRGQTQELVQDAARCGFEALVLTADFPVMGDRRTAIPTQIRRDHGQLSGPVDDRMTPDVIGWLREASGLPVLVKGILRGDDARDCIAAGASGVIVSNHGGRQLDGAVSTAAALPEVRRALESGEVYVDGGIRRGTDVLKALALGARAVLVGRPVLWGLATSGEAGVRDVLEGLRTGLERAMKLCGARALQDLSPDLVADPR